MNDDYSDIIGMEHHVSCVYPQMSMSARAAQFAPFAALTGHDEAVRETERETEMRMDICDDYAEEMDQVIREIINDDNQASSVSITYFEHDERKKGGSYKNVCAHIANIDEVSREIVLSDSRRIPISSVFSVERCGVLK